MLAGARSTIPEFVNCFSVFMGFRFARIPGAIRQLKEGKTDIDQGLLCFFFGVICSTWGPVLASVITCRQWHRADDRIRNLCSLRCFENRRRIAPLSIHKLTYFVHCGLYSVW